MSVTPTSAAAPAGAPAGPPRRERLGERRWRWSLLLGGWALLGLVFVGPIVAQAVAEQQRVPWSKVISELFGWYLWAPFLPLVVAFTARFPLVRREGRTPLSRQALRWARRAAAHLAFGALVSAAYVVLSLAKNEAVMAAFAGRFSLRNVLELAPAYLLSGIEFYLLVYFAIVAVVHAVSFYEKYRDRERRASQLESQLALAQLQLLRMQLHPHFLFNTLNAVSSLMHSNVDEADRALSLLSDLLRYSMEEDDRHLVPLRRELDLLDRYLAIERMRFRDRLSVEIDVPGDCATARVPRLLLQPLVENSIRHAVAVRSAAGRIVVRGRRRGDRLDLEVRDDGPGMPPEARRRVGLGLSNTRARLEQLYGPDHHLLFENLTPGLSVRLDIPFDEEGREPSGILDAARVFSTA